jgi:hypothetical protein
MFDFSFLIIVMLTGVKCYLIVVLIFIFLKISDVDFFIHLLASCMSFVVGVYFYHLPIFKIV